MRQPRKSTEAKLSSSIERFPHADAMAAANAVVDLLSPHCQRIEVAGSLRRGSPDVGDIEIVCIPARGAVFGSPFGDSVRRYLASAVTERAGWRYRLDKRGRHTFGESNCYMRFEHAGRSYPVDIFMAAGPESWGALYFVRTGPQAFIQAACTRANRLGYSLRPYLGLEKVEPSGKEGDIIWLHEERAVFHALGMPWREPSERTESAAKELLNVSWVA